MVLIDSVPTGPKTIDWSLGDVRLGKYGDRFIRLTDQYAGREYLGPETNWVPHKIVRVGECCQDCMVPSCAIPIREGWLCYELEGGLVVATDDPATVAERYEIRGEPLFPWMEADPELQSV